MVEKSRPPAAATHADFGRLVSARLDKLGLNNREAGTAIGVTPEMIRRYREGLVMPRDQKLERLAKLLGLTAAELRYSRPGKAPTVAGLPLTRLAPDEQALLEEYRQLPPFARKAARARIIELLEEFARPSPKNPFGKGTQ